jgi:NAD(P)-dependent dehydrogenase (short-subunit alcohol dehydrogenase family)
MPRHHLALGNFPPLAKDYIHMMNKRFSGKAVLIAGGTGGLGRAVALAFLNEEATVTVTYRKQEEFAAMPQDPRLEGFQADVTDENAVRGLTENIIGRHGKLDALVNTVGGYSGGTKFWEADAGTLSRMLAANLQSGYTLCRVIVPIMLKQKHGSIINIAAKAGADPSPAAGAYSASKAAAIAMMASLAADLKGSGVRVNSVLPSIIDTEANRKSMPKADFSKWPTPEQIAKVLLFLSSDDAAVIHGASIPVYGSV